MRFDFFSPPFGLIDKPLHDFRVFAGMNGEHPAAEEGTVFLSDGLILIF